MRDDFDPVVADRFKVLDQVPVPDTWSRIQFKLLDPTSARFTEQDAVNGTDFLAALPRRSTTVTLIDTEPTSTPTERRHRWPVVALAAAAVVAIVVGALVLAARDDSGPQVPADTTINNNTTVAPDAATAAEEIARDFLDAYAANDADRALTYLSDDAIAAGPLLASRGRRAWESAEEFRRTLAWNAAAGYKLTVNGCERSDGGTDTVITVQCGYDVHALGSDALGLGPFPGNPGWILTVRGGKIVTNSYDESPGGLYTLVWEPFANWISTEHPDDIMVMYTDRSGDLNTQATTDAARRLWEQRTAEYVQAVLTGP